MKYTNRSKQSVINKLVSLLMIMLMIILPITPDVPVKAASALLDGVKTVEVNDLDTAKFPSVYTSFGERIYNNCEVAIPIDLTSLNGGTVKVWFAIKGTINGQGTVRVTDNYTIYSGFTDTKTLNATNNNIKAFLEGGKKYYCVITWSGLQKDEFVMRDDFAVAVLYENGNSQEVFPVNDKSTPNPLTSGVGCKGFLTYNSKSDFYSFTVPDNTSVTLKYSFDGSRNDTGWGNVTVYDSSKFSVVGQTTIPKETANRYSEMELDLGTLRAGTYLVELTGLYGRTTIQYSPTSYDIKFQATKDEKTGKTTVAVITQFATKEILCINEDVGEDLKESGLVWGDTNENKVVVKSGKFEATKGGTYTVRVMSESNKYYIAQYKMELVDSEGPVVSGVEDKAAYRSGQKIKFIDEGSGIDYATLNGKQVKSGIRISESGEYTLKVVDNSKNETTIIFYIDYKAPVIENFQNGKNYATGGACSWYDELSGIGYVEIDGAEVNILTYSRTDIGTPGKHTVVVKDKAGNTTSCIFTIGL